MIIVEVMGGLETGCSSTHCTGSWSLWEKMPDWMFPGFSDKERQTKVLASRKLELSWFENLPAKYCTQEEKQAILGKNNLVGKLKKKLLGGSNRHFTGKRHVCIRKSPIWRTLI